jgi:putrescine transport system permease protein
MNRLTLGRRAILVSGFAFLYLPILVLVAMSFNDSRLVTVWGGFSTRWYAALLESTALRDAASTSLQAGALSATIATLLGIPAAYALARCGPFRGRALFAGLAQAPLVTPEVVLGLGFLLLFSGLGAPRGFWTVTLAHATLSCAYVIVVVQARLAVLDVSLEEAARDLGHGALGALLSVVLPNILPSVAAGWLLAFTLSLDDLVVASFVGGPGATTLPVRVYSQVRMGVSPEINAAFSVLIGLVALGVLAAAFARRAPQPASTNILCGERAAARP